MLEVKMNINNSIELGSYQLVRVYPLQEPKYGEDCLYKVYRNKKFTYLYIVFPYSDAQLLISELFALTGILYRNPKDKTFDKLQEYPKLFLNTKKVFYFVKDTLSIKENLKAREISNLENCITDCYEFLKGATGDDYQRIKNIYLA